MASISTAFHITKTGMQVQEMNLAVRAQNIAAQGADGYKRQYLVAFDLPYQDDGFVGSNTTDSGNNLSLTGIQVGSGVETAGIYRVFTEGERIQTGEALDLLIEGDGFYEILLPDGTFAYTRVGSFKVGPDGVISMIKTGYQLNPSITVPENATSVRINASGQVFVRIAGQTAEQQIGQIQLATFMNKSGLRAMGDSMFVETAASGAPVVDNPGNGRNGLIKHGWREGSNVSAVEEITGLIQIEKIYDMLTKVLKTGDSMMEAANRMGRA